MDEASNLLLSDIQEERGRYNEALDQISDMKNTILENMGTGVPLAVLLTIIHILWKERHNAEQVNKVVLFLSEALKTFVNFLREAVSKLYKKVTREAPGTFNFFKENPEMPTPIATLMLWLNWLKKWIRSAPPSGISSLVNEELMTQNEEIKSPKPKAC
jgi:hypothetical protein